MTPDIRYIFTDSGRKVYYQIMDTMHYRRVLDQGVRWLSPRSVIYSVELGVISIFFIFAPPLCSTSN